MLKNQDIICLSSIDWDFIWQGHQEIMSTFAKNGNRVIYIENTGVRMPGLRDFPRVRSRIKNYFKGVKGLRKEGDNLYIFSPIVLPFPYSRLARMFNKWLILSVLRKWIKALDFADPIIWTFLPTGTALDIINNLNNKLIVYYCIDLFAASSSTVKKIKRTEKRLLKIADLVFVTSKALYDYCSAQSRNVTVFPFGVNIDNFEVVRVQAAPQPADLKDIKAPIIGYIGGIHKWIDFALVKKAAELRPEYSFVFVGPIQTDVSLLAGLKNVYLLGNKAHKELPFYVKLFSTAIIPYLLTDYTKNVYPTKLNEYFAMAKPVVSTPLPEIMIFNQRNDDPVLVAEKAEDFCACLDASLKDNVSAAIATRLKIAAANGWIPRIEQMCGLIEEAIKAKKLANEACWKKNMFAFYRESRRRIFRFALTCLVVYLFIFYTPIIWFLARPLKIVDVPRKVDAIIVFAGGMGESGKWGQGYEERVQYAVELYKSGYARSLIFSSGYTHVFKEPLVMKALAVSLGVPENAILLEDKAIRTYENVKNAKEILEKNNWKNILMVSSPYHMRRLQLVFRKVAGNIRVGYTPAPKSIFYDHPESDASGRKIWKRANLQQINGITHEYIGIFYYWVKGWI